MVFSMFLQHKWSMILMILKTKNPKLHFFKSKSLDNFTDTPTHLINHSTGKTSSTFLY